MNPTLDNCQNFTQQSDWEDHVFDNCQTLNKPSDLVVISSVTIIGDDDTEDDHYEAYLSQCRLLM